MKVTFCPRSAGCRCLEIADLKERPQWIDDLDPNDAVYVYDTDYPTMYVQLDKRLNVDDFAKFLDKIKEKYGQLETIIKATQER